MSPSDSGISFDWVVFKTYVLGKGNVITMAVICNKRVKVMNIK
jgi:hypothetical protein